jgi:hypothetical protein
MTITVGSTAQTIAYTDLSNNTSGTVPYTVNSDGTYTLNDPTGNLLTAYEVPNYALLIQAAKTGPNSNTPALITAVESEQISINTFEGQAYNYMQFRTSSGGLEVGAVSVNIQGTGSITSFWPYGSYNRGNQGSECSLRSDGGRDLQGDLLPENERQHGRRQRGERNSWVSECHAGHHDRRRRNGG